MFVGWVLSEEPDGRTLDALFFIEKVQGTQEPDEVPFLVPVMDPTREVA